MAQIFIKNSAISITGFLEYFECLIVQFFFNSNNNSSQIVGIAQIFQTDLCYLHHLRELKIKLNVEDVKDIKKYVPMLLKDKSHRDIEYTDSW